MAFVGLHACGGDELAQTAPPLQMPCNRHQAPTGTSGPASSAAIGIGVGTGCRGGVAQVEFAAVQQMKGPGLCLIRRLIRCIKGCHKRCQMAAQTAPGPHHAGHRAFIGDGQGFVAQIVAAAGQFMRVRSPALKTEITQAMQLGIAWQIIWQIMHRCRAKTIETARGRPTPNPFQDCGR